MNKYGTLKHQKHRKAKEKEKGKRENSKNISQIQIIHLKIHTFAWLFIQKASPRCIRQEQALTLNIKNKNISLWLTHA